MNSTELPQATDLDQKEFEEVAAKLPSVEPLAPKSKPQLLAERMMNEISLLNATQAQNLDNLISKVESSSEALLYAEKLLIEEILAHREFLRKEELRLHQRILDHIELVAEGEKTQEIIAGVFKEMREKVLPPEKAQANGESR